MLKCYRNFKIMRPNVSRYIGGVSCAGLLALTFMLINPSTRLEANAIEKSQGIETQKIAASEVNISFTPPSGEASLTPIAETGTKTQMSVLANVDVVSSGGYSVYIGSSQTHLAGRRTGQTIPGVGNPAGFDDLPVNTWGYYTGEGSAIPENAQYQSLSQGQGTIIYQNEGPRIRNEQKQFVLGFAINVPSNIPADTYENQVTLSVVSSPYQLMLSEIDDMQEMTTAICENTPILTDDSSNISLASKQLRDVRDGKYYWVTKLKDGNCWMTQNLDLDLSYDVVTETGKAVLPLLKETSDVESLPNGTWDPQADDPEGLFAPTATSVNENTILANSAGMRSWSLGDYRITDPGGTGSCGDGRASLAECTQYFTMMATPTKPFENPTSAEAMNAHYLVGNYYQWGAAVAGAGNNTSSGEAPSSICPKGWRLPAGGTSMTDSFAGLQAAGNLGADVNNWTSAPYYFVRGGIVFQSSDSLRHAGHSHYSWSSTAVSDTRAYDIVLYATNGTNVSEANNRMFGNSVRCLAR